MQVFLILDPKVNDTRGVRPGTFNLDHLESKTLRNGQISVNPTPKFACIGTSGFWNASGARFNRGPKSALFHMAYGWEQNAIFYNATRVDTFYTTAAIMSGHVNSILTPENVAWHWHGLPILPITHSWIFCVTAVRIQNSVLWVTYRQVNYGGVRLTAQINSVWCINFYLLL